jgi:hypothetical protein
MLCLGLEIGGRQIVASADFMAGGNPILGYDKIIRESRVLPRLALRGGSHRGGFAAGRFRRGSADHWRPHAAGNLCPRSRGSRFNISSGNTQPVSDHPRIAGGSLNSGLL